MNPAASVEWIISCQAFKSSSSASAVSSTVWRPAQLSGVNVRLAGLTVSPLDGLMVSDTVTSWQWTVIVFRGGAGLS